MYFRRAGGGEERAKWSPRALWLMCTRRGRYSIDGTARERGTYADVQKEKTPAFLEWITLRRALRVRKGVIIDNTQKILDDSLDYV